MRVIAIFLLLVLAMTMNNPFLSAGEVRSSSDCCGQAVCEGSRGATVLSMMGWGVGLGIGVALLCGLLEQSETTHAH